MIAQAQALDREHRCQFVLNERSDLSIFPDNEFDLIYSNIVLQHMRPDYSTGYMREFCRVLAPGGVAVFQIPSKKFRKDWKDFVRPLIPLPLLHYRRKFLRAHSEMYTVPKSQVLHLIAANGCRLVGAIKNGASVPAYESWRYCMVKR